MNTATTTTPTTTTTTAVSTELAYHHRRERVHPNCVLCGPHNPIGLKLRFESDGSGGARTWFDASTLFQGYPDRLHGGMIAALLDAVMTNCLFMRKIVAVTAELNIRYLKPVPTSVRIEAWAALVHSYAPLHIVQAEIRLCGEKLVAAQAKFMATPGGQTACEE